MNSKGFIALVVCLPIIATADVLDYQVLRLVMMKTDCQRDVLQRDATQSGVLMFHVSCKNVSHYPDGLQIICRDASDERSCKLMNKGVKFNHLKLLQGNDS